jgi:hypothetical protein
VLRHPFNWQRTLMAVGLCLGVGRRRRLLAVLPHPSGIHPGSYDTVSLIEVLKQLRAFLGCQKATVLWDGLPVHRSTAMAALVASQRDWLVVERLPGYAPELNTAEQVWANLKGNELANLACQGLGGVAAAALQGIERTRAARHLPKRSCATAACRLREAAGRQPPA